jgi:pimeloyl-ACP methyl ester carboxylesterase
MDHKYIRIDNSNLAYIEKNSQEADTLFFIHGNSGSSRLWYKLFDGKLLDHYRLIALDLPGHGHSDAINDEADINLLHIASLLSKAVNALAAGTRYVLIGFSLGANLVAEMLPLSPAPLGVVLVSPTVIGDNIAFHHTLKEGANPAILFTDEPSPAELTHFMQEILEGGTQADVSVCLEDFNAVEKPFRSMILKTAMAGKVSDELHNLSVYGRPTLVVFGKYDKIINPNYLDQAALPHWDNTICKLDPAGHYVMLNQPDALAELLLPYCRNAFK